MKVKMIGDKFEAVPETASELEMLLENARRDREHFGQGAMPSVKMHLDRAGSLQWWIDLPAPQG